MKFLAFSLITLSSVFVGAFSAPSESIQKRDVFILKFETHTAQDAASDLTKFYLMTHPPK
jgi:hypothetical protein